MKKTIATIITLILSSTVIIAQNYFGFLNDHKQVTSLGANANPNLSINADYLMSFEDQGKHLQKYGFVARANLPLFSQKGFDFDFGVGTGFLMNFSKRFKTIAGLSWNFSRTQDLNGRYFHAGFKIDVFPGYYGYKWVFSPHVSINYQPLINIRHSEYAKQAFEDLYPTQNGQFKAPKDGWFYQNSLVLQTGIGIVYYKPNWHLGLTTGFQYQPNRLGVVLLPDLGILPFYGGINFGYCLQSNKGK